MGGTLLDQYSLLHFATGVVAYFWGISFMTNLVLHTLFELIENTALGMWVINNVVRVWPGGKPHPDSTRNMLGDTAANIAGWLLAAWLDSVLVVQYL